MPWLPIWTPIRPTTTHVPRLRPGRPPIVDDLARRMAASGTSLTEAVGLFVAARRPFLNELAGLGRRRALDAARLAGLYENATGLLDRLLLRLVETHQGEAG